jgi:hypothetical protein
MISQTVQYVAQPVQHTVYLIACVSLFYAESAENTHDNLRTIVVSPSSLDALVAHCSHQCTHSHTRFVEQSLALPQSLA